MRGVNYYLVLAMRTGLLAAIPSPTMTSSVTGLALSVLGPGLSVAMLSLSTSGCWGKF